LPGAMFAGALHFCSTVKKKTHISSLVLCGKQPSPALLNRVDAPIAVQKNIVSRSQRRQPCCRPLSHHRRYKMASSDRKTSSMPVT
jgi:hypothetical protein